MVIDYRKKDFVNAVLQIPTIMSRPEPYDPQLEPVYTFVAPSSDQDYSVFFRVMDRQFDCANQSFFALVHLHICRQRMIMKLMDEGILYTNDQSKELRQRYILYKSDTPPDESESIWKAMCVKADKGKRMFSIITCTLSTHSRHPKHTK